MPSELVDWSGDWTPPGSFALCKIVATETTTKRPVGTEIIPSLCRRTIFHLY
ncbi:hypothetical protein [Lysinibacillus xylanilyticus]|uniref:hypothetical protein n=1 Tax=Lysinibacillus xylanilyticus TaxID=582475 RepID=UPI003CFC4D27